MVMLWGEAEESWFEFCLLSELLCCRPCGLPFSENIKWKSNGKKVLFWANLISHTLAHADKGIHPQGVPLFLRTDFVGEKTFCFQRRRLHSTEWNRNMAIIQFIYLLYTVRQTNPGSTGYKKHQEMPELSRFTTNIVPRRWMSARLAQQFVLLNIVPGEPVPADLERKGQAEVTPRPRWHLMGVTLGLAELRLHCLQSTYHMEGRAACQNTDTRTKQRIIAINPIQRAKTEMSAKHVSWLDSSTHRTAG